MDMKPVKSSNIASVGYDAETKVLRVEFTSGATYNYDGVSQQVHAEMMASSSVGGFLASRIKNKHAHTRHTEIK